MVKSKINRDRFFHVVEKELGFEGMDHLQWAYSLSKYYHRDQKRDDGQRYFEHCRAVALILLKYGPTTVDELIAALLHDVYEDQYVPAGMLKRLFGNEMDYALKALSKEKILYKGRGKIERIQRKEEDYFKTILGASLLIRRVKLADRLHNLSSINVQEKGRKKRKVAETRKFIIPIARATDKRFNSAISKLCDKIEKSLR